MTPAAAIRKAALEATPEDNQMHWLAPWIGTDSELWDAVEPYIGSLPLWWLMEHKEEDRRMFLLFVACALADDRQTVL